MEGHDRALHFVWLERVRGQLPLIINATTIVTTVVPTSSVGVPAMGAFFSGGGVSQGAPK